MKSQFRFILLLTLFSLSLIHSQETLKFHSLNDMNSERYGMGSVSDGVNFYAVCGGISFPPLISNSIEKFDVSENKWSILTESLLQRRYGNAEYLKSQNKIYVFNGEFIHPGVRGFSKQVEVVDLNTNQISYGAENPYPVKGAGSVVWNNKIYFFGGQNLNGFSDEFYEFDPATNMWQRLPDMLKAKQTSGEVIDGKLYVIGGYDGAQRIKEIDVYDFSVGKWSKSGKLPYRVSAHSTAADGNKIWIVGSYEDSDYLAVYDTKTNEISEIKSNMISRRHAGAEVIQNKLFIFGGSQNENALSALRSTEVADISLLNKN